MTLEEAIKHCEEVAEEAKTTPCIKGGLVEKCGKEHEQLAEWLKELKAYKERPQGDLISREALKEAIKEAQAEGFVEVANAFDCVYDLIDNAPTVYPICEDKACKYRANERPQGEWIKNNETVFVNRFNCSECGRLIFEPKEKNNFCPNCGADMRGA